MRVARRHRGDWRGAPGCARAGEKQQGGRQDQERSDSPETVHGTVALSVSRPDATAQQSRKQNAIASGRRKWLRLRPLGAAPSLLALARTQAACLAPGAPCRAERDCGCRSPAPSPALLPTADGAPLRSRRRGRRPLGDGARAGRPLRDGALACRTCGRCRRRARVSATRPRSPTLGPAVRCPARRVHTHRWPRGRALCERPFGRLGDCGCRRTTGNAANRPERRLARP